MSAVRDKVALGVALSGGLLFFVLALALLPWSTAPQTDGSMVGEYFTPDQVARAEWYSARARAWSWSSLGLSLATLVALVSWRRFMRAMARLPGPWWFSTFLATCAVMGIERLVTLPLALGGWQLRIAAGLALPGWGGWLRDVGVGWGTSVVITSLLLLLVLGARRRWRRSGTAVAALVASVAVAVGSAVYPLVLEPLSHRFTSLPDGELRSAIEEVAAAQDVDVRDIVVADASRRTTTLNAWVSGIGPTRRIVLYDTLLDRVPQGEVIAVVAHELAHAQQGHVLKGTALGSAGAVLGVGVLGLLLSAGRWPLRTGGVAGRGREATLVAGVVLCMAVGAQLAAPVQNGASRMIEREADRVSLETGANQEDLVQLQVSLAERSLADPTPPWLSQWWWGSHPTVLERIAAARHDAAVAEPD